MTIPLEIVARQVTIPELSRARIERLAAKLESFDDRLLGCRIVVDAPQRFPAGRVVEYRVTIRLEVPGEDLVVRRRQDPDLDTAIQKAFLVAGRRLQDAVRLRRGQVKRRAVTEGIDG